MGSEFAYEDMSSYEPEKYKFNYLRDEPCGEWTCHVLESIPVDENSGYAKQITWLDTEHLRPVKTEYYDRKDALLKTLECLSLLQELITTTLMDDLSKLLDKTTNGKLRNLLLQTLQSLSISELKTLLHYPNPQQLESMK